MPTVSFPQRPAKLPDTVELFLDPEEPHCKYRIVGLYDSANAWHAGDNGGVYEFGRSGLMEMRKDAASRGLDGLMHVECGGMGTVGRGKCTAAAYICE